MSVKAAAEDRVVVAAEPAPRVLPGLRFRWALGLALAADALQLAIFPMFFEGAVEPATDVVDLVMAGAMYGLLGWHWEFLPSFAGKLVPGVDLVPLWTLAVANVYRKQKRTLATQPPPESHA